MQELSRDSYREIMRYVDTVGRVVYLDQFTFSPLAGERGRHYIVEVKDTGKIYLSDEPTFREAVYLKDTGKDTEQFKKELYALIEENN